VTGCSLLKLYRYITRSLMSNYRTTSEGVVRETCLHYIRLFEAIVGLEGFVAVGNCKIPFLVIGAYCIMSSFCLAGYLSDKPEGRWGFSHRFLRDAVAQYLVLSLEQFVSLATFEFVNLATIKIYAFNGPRLSHLGRRSMRNEASTADQRSISCRPILRIASRISPCYIPIAK
jgi:hypothetical protein